MTLGVIPQKNNLYALRILGSCGEFSYNELLNLAEVTKKFGFGNVTATSRGTIEVNGITEQKLEDAIAAVQQCGLRLGGTGTTVRVIVACKGTDCRRGMFDVHGLACKLNKEFYGINVPKKFKIGVFGCLNSLGKAMSQDIGVMPSFTDIGKFELYVGGLLGNSPIQGVHIPVPLAEEKLTAAIKHILTLYQKKGSYPQRLRAVLDADPELWNDIRKYIQELAAM